ncbi:(Fe-S)-binding protein [Acidocella sp.]|uniref:(Fe-S)-binding protein n=1 Tax=Acidocella sp. TaxID=50710 RepID=UPI002610B62B|nr:(Fe-S)-binding protein [Acidocella sp.]
MSTPTSPAPRVALFATCLVDALRPAIGFSALELLEQAGCTVEIPPTQTCCGQPALNSGDQAGAAALARRNIALLEGFDAIIIPSGSCAGTLRSHYPELFPPTSPWHARAQSLAAKTFELLSYLHDIRHWRPQNLALPASCTYHDSCSGLRELGVKHQPRALLAGIAGLTLTEMPEAETCCGFGGTFCVKYPAISTAIVSEKTANIAATGADLLLGGDLGCLMNMAGRLHRQGVPVRAFHAAELLAGRGHGPAIGEPE